MSFFNIAIKNMQKKFFSYMTYFLSTAFSVSVFYIFCSIYFNPQFSNYRLGISKMGILFKFAAIAVLLFSFVFVFYSNMFFLKTHKKEMAIFSLLGMKKDEIGRILFYETFFVGILSMLSGILIGMIFSRFFSMILLKLMEVGSQGSRVVFSIQWEPAVASVIVFIVLFAINAIYSYKTVYRYKLIELLSADKEGERSPKVSPLAALLSVVLIASSYVIFLNFKADVSGFDLIWPAFGACILLAVGTYLLFQNMVTFFAKKLQSNANFYFKTNNFLSTSQIVYRIKNNANVLSVIALLSAIAVAMVSATFAFYKGISDIIPTYQPFSYLLVNASENQCDKVIDTIKQNSQVKLLSVTNFDILSLTASIPTYKVDFGHKTGAGKPFKVSVIRMSDYQTIIKNQQPVNSKGIKDMSKTIGDGECLLIDGNISDEYSKGLPGKENVSLSCGSEVESYKILSISRNKYVGLYTKATIVVNDHDYSKVLAEINTTNKISYTGFMLDKPLNSASLVDNLNKDVPNDNRYMSYIEWYKAFFAQYGAYIFIGMFLGVLFLLAAGSIIFYKQLMEAREESGRYEILRKIGLKRKEARQSISKQLAIIFFLPLLIGLIHSFICLLTFQNLMSTLVSENSSVLANSLTIVIIYISVYGLYYLLSVNSYMRTVWNKEA